MRIIARYSKEDSLSFISHLDLQRIIQRALRRAMLPVQYSMGFNPHPVLSFASALSVGHTGGGECMDVKLDGVVTPEDFMARMNNALPKGLALTCAAEAEETLPALTVLLTSADYEITLFCAGRLDDNAIENAMRELMSNEIVVYKRTKSGMKNVDIRPMLINMQYLGGGKLAVSGVLNAGGGLNAELLMKALISKLNIEADFKVHRSLLCFSQDLFNNGLIGVKRC